MAGSEEGWWLLSLGRQQHISLGWLRWLNYTYLTRTIQSKLYIHIIHITQCQRYDASGLAHLFLPWVARWVPPTKPTQHFLHSLFMLVVLAMSMSSGFNICCSILYLVLMFVWKMLFLLFSLERATHNKDAIWMLVGICVYWWSGYWWLYTSDKR